MDSFDQDNHAGRLNCKIGEDMVGKLFPKLPRSFNRNPENRHFNRTGRVNLNYKLFVQQLQHWTMNDLPNASNNIRVALYSMKKKHLKLLADYINDFMNNNSSDFLYLAWYLMALDIIECKLFIEPPKITKRPNPKYRCNITFCNKALDFINLPKILRSNEVLQSGSCNIDESEIPMVVYSLNKPIRSKIFNYHQFVRDLDLTRFTEDNNSIHCYCNEFDGSFTNPHHGHIITDDLGIVNNTKLRKLLSKGPKHREPVQVDWKEAREQIITGLDQYIDQLSLDKGLDKVCFVESKNTVLRLVDDKINVLKAKIKPKKVSKKNFNKFGQIIDTSKKKYFKINDGYAKRFDNLINVDASKNKGKAIVSIFKAKKRRFPMKIDMMEKHPLGSQAFIPMEDTKFLVFVAPKGDKPDVNKIQSFLVPKQTGVNYNAGIWHFPLISMKNMNFLIVDRKGKGNNLVIYKFKKDKIILKK